jgi:hypothetical protein
VLSCHQALFAQALLCLILWLHLPSQQRTQNVPHSSLVVQDPSQSLLETGLSCEWGLRAGGQSKVTHYYLESLGPVMKVEDQNSRNS